MKIAVRYMAQLRQAAGVAAEVVELDEAGSLADLLRLLAERRGAELCRLLLANNGSPQPTLLVFVGDAQADVSRTTLTDGDEVTLLSPIAGGQRDV